MLTTIFGRGRVRLLVAGSVALLALGVGGLIGAAVASAAGPKLVQFVRPTGDTLVQKGTGPIRVIVQLRHGARLTEGRCRRGGRHPLAAGEGRGATTRALAPLRRHLHYGYNDAFAQATGRNGSRATDHVRFIVAQRDDSLLRLTSFRAETTAAPLQVGRA